jgi:hypothetical protein
VELAVRGTCERSVSPMPLKQELDAVYARLQSRTYNDLRAQLSKKGWLVSSVGGSTPTGGASRGSAYPGNVSA